MNQLLYLNFKFNNEFATFYLGFYEMDNSSLIGRLYVIHRRVNHYFVLIFEIDFIEKHTLANLYNSVSWRICMGSQTLCRRRWKTSLWMGCSFVWSIRFWGLCSLLFGRFPRSPGSEINDSRAIWMIILYLHSNLGNLQWYFGFGNRNISNAVFEHSQASSCTKWGQSHHVWSSIQVGCLRCLVIELFDSGWPISSVLFSTPSFSGIPLC